MLYYVYKPKIDTPRTKNTLDDENAYKLGPKYGGESTCFHRHMISVVAFSYSETLKGMLIKYAATEMGFLDDYSDADPNHRSIMWNGITTFIFHVAQCIVFNLTNHVKTILIANVSLKTFYSRLGFSVIKDFVTSTNFEVARRRFHYKTGKSKADQKQTIGLQCLQTIPRRVTFLHDYRMNINTQENVFRDLDSISTSETWFTNKCIEDEIKKN